MTTKCRLRPIFRVTNQLTFFVTCSFFIHLMPRQITEITDTRTKLRKKRDKSQFLVFYKESHSKIFKLSSLLINFHLLFALLILVFHLI